MQMIHVLFHSAARHLLFCLPMFLLTWLPVASQHASIGLIVGASADARHLGGEIDLVPSGWSIGASALLQPFYPFGIRGDAVYSSINRKFLFSSNAGADTADIDFSLLSIPLYLRFELKDSGSVPYVYAGTTVGVILTAIDNDAVNLVDRNADGELYNTFSATADLGIGVTSPIAKKLSLTVDLRGSWVLRSMAPVDLEAWEFDRMGVVAGLFYRLF